MPSLPLEWNDAGLAALLKDSGVGEFVHSCAENVAEAARANAPHRTGEFGGSFRVEDAVHDRVVSQVVSDDPKGLFKEIKHRTMTNALSGGGK